MKYEQKSHQLKMYCFIWAITLGITNCILPISHADTTFDVSKWSYDGLNQVIGVTLLENFFML